jgi:hypothetical protein
MAVGVAAVDAAMAGAVMEAEAGVAPKVYTRDDWNAVAAKRAPKVLDRAPDHIIVHHTASPNASETSRAHAFALSRQIQRFHMETNGWDDIGEQLTISRGGHVMEGRTGSLEAIAHDGLVVGAQSLHHNKHTIGIENEGTYMNDEVPTRLWRSLVGVCAWLCTAHHLSPATAIVGHRDYNDTDCPGDVLYRKLPQLRKEVARAIAKDKDDVQHSLVARHKHRTGRH